jgi:hypothetical protein
MDKKEAEAEAMKKAKEAQSTAGKSSGMSGRDLVRSFTWPTHLHIYTVSDCPCEQFQYNPEWFEDEDEGDASDDWDLAKYRREKEAEDLAEEELRIANLALQNGFLDGEAAGSGGGRE